MGVLTDFFLATESQVASFDPEGLPADLFDTFHAKGVDTIKVDLLFAALTGRSFAEVANCGEVISDIESEGPWIFRLPDELLTCLAAIEPSELPSVAAKWHHSEDFAGWAPNDVELVLRGLVALAKRAGSPDVHLYHWVCV